MYENTGKRTSTGQILAGRSYTLTVKRKTTGDNYLDEFVIQGGSSWGIERPINISFDISRSADIKHKGANSAAIEIYNLDRDRIAVLNQSSQSLHCTLAVSYDSFSDDVVLFSGDVKTVETRKSGTEYITQIQMGDGYATLKESNLKGYIPPGVTVGQALEQLRQQIPNLSRGVFVGTNLNNPISSGWRISGKAKDVLKKFCEAHRLEYTINNGVMNVTSVNMPSSANKDMATYIGPDSGMIDVPFNAGPAPVSAKGDKRQRPRMQVKALLNPEVYPTQLIVVPVDGLDIVYRVADIRYSGEFNGNDWIMELSCTEIEPGDLDDVAANTLKPSSSSVDYSQDNTIN
ncbi:hypothetical protein [Pseudomonas kurunegalensis]|uniref:hypothetical protein n=1 Tax=Pseudomonas kurunegalensis TaxID=485880 RepID=UPI004026974F